MTSSRHRRTIGRPLVVLALGAAAVVTAMGAGSSDILRALLEPPFPANALLGTGAALVGVVVMLRAAARIGGAKDDARELIRAVRMVFVAVGAFAAAAGWFIGSAVPIVAGLIILGIDVVETTFLLLVTGAQPGTGSATGPSPDPLAVPSGPDDPSGSTG